MFWGKGGVAEPKAAGISGTQKDPFIVFVLHGGPDSKEQPLPPLCLLFYQQLFPMADQPHCASLHKTIQSFLPLKPVLGPLLPIPNKAHQSYAL